MPAATERRLKRRARKLYPHNQEKQDHYTYGTLTKIKKRHDAKIARQHRYGAVAKGRAAIRRRKATTRSR